MVNTGIRASMKSITQFTTGELGFPVSDLQFIRGKETRMLSDAMVTPFCTADPFAASDGEEGQLTGQTPPQIIKGRRVGAPVIFEVLIPERIQRHADNQKRYDGGDGHHDVQDNGRPDGAAPVLVAGALGHAQQEHGDGVAGEEEGGGVEDVDGQMEFGVTVEIAQLHVIYVPAEPVLDIDSNAAGVAKSQDLFEGGCSD